MYKKLDGIEQEALSVVLVRSTPLIIPLDVCTEICQDGLVVGSEACDDGNGVNNDGCDSSCHIETYWECASTSGSSK